MKDYIWIYRIVIYRDKFHSVDEDMSVDLPFLGAVGLWDCGTVGLWDCDGDIG